MPTSPCRAATATRRAGPRQRHPSRPRAKNRPWHPALTDYGIRVEPSPLGYIDITTERMIFAPAVEKQAQLLPLASNWTAAPRRPAGAYLSGQLDRAGRPQSALFHDHCDRFSRAAAAGAVSFPSTASPPPSWATAKSPSMSGPPQRLQAKVGDCFRVSYYEPESTSGLLHERTEKLEAGGDRETRRRGGRQAAHAHRSRPDRQRHRWTIGTCRSTSSRSIREQRDEDTLLAKVRRHAQGLRFAGHGPAIVGSRFGQTTSLRVAPARGNDGRIACRAVDLDPDEQGFVFRPIRKLALDAAGGTTPFGLYFLYFSFFVIAAAAMLVVLLFRLGIEQRAKQLGLLLALGFRPSQALRLLIAEGLIAAGCGKRDRRIGRHCVCGAHAVGPADLVAAGDRHAVSYASPELAKPGNRVRRAGSCCRRR